MPSPRFAPPLPKTLPVSKTWLAAVLALAAVIVAALYPGVGEAQEPGGEGGYVDVGLTLLSPSQNSSIGPGFNVIVTNYGTRTAYDVEIVVNVVYPKNTSYFQLARAVTIGSASLENDGKTFRWKIPAIGGWESVETGTYKTGPGGYRVWVVSTESDDQNNVVFDKLQDPHEFFGEVTTPSFESDLRKRNNTDRIWAIGRTQTTLTAFKQAEALYRVDNVTVDNLNPPAGGVVNFTIAATMGQNIDTKIAIELTDGLSVDEDSTATPPREISYEYSLSTAPPPSYSNGVFTIGTRSTDKIIHTLSSATVPVRVTSGSVVNEQCLTATITGNPPPGPNPGDDDISDNVAKVCLGNQPVEPFVSGQVDAFTIYPCVGVTTAPCDSTDDVRVRAVDSIGRVLTPGTAIFYVDPLQARIYDAKTGHSVNDGNTVSWQTAVNPSRTYKDGLSTGVELYYSRTPYTGTTGWGGLTMGIAARNVEGNTPPPGKVFLRSTSSGNEFRKAESPDYEELRTAPTGSSTPTTKLNYFLEFEKLGTYKFTWYAYANRSTSHGSENCNPNTADPPVNQTFCATETYIFHVGPMADLAVKDGGQSGRVAADQSALSIIAVNNGPDQLLGARVTGLPSGAEVLHISHGIYDGSTGVWNIGELKVRGYYRSRGEPEPSLVLGASAGDTATVKIASSKDYEVCVGPKDNPGNLAHDNQTDCEAVTNASWNSTPVYDYNDSNNTATITAVAGTGGGGEGAPGEADSPVETSRASVTVQWQPVATVNGLAVSHYEVERSASPWNMVADNVEGTSYIDTDVQPGKTYQYRVRAVNMAGVEGPWSAPIQARAPAPPRPSTGSGSSSRSRSSDDDDDDYAHFAARTTTRSVVENSAAGSPVGNPVVAAANRGNRVTYYLEGGDAGLFDIEPDSGQILVGEDLVLDHEGGPDSYTVVVVADPRRGGTDRVTVTINVIDAPETASLSLSPEGQPVVGEELTALVEPPDGPEGEVEVVSWQWQRSAGGASWQTIAGAAAGSYTPTGADAGHRLRVIVLYRPPGDGDSLSLTGLVTPPLPGEAAKAPETEIAPEAKAKAEPEAGAGPDAASTEAGKNGTDQAPAALGVALLPGGVPAAGDPVVAYLVGNRDGLVWSGWQWQRSRDGVSWQDIAGAMGDYYEPTPADAGHFLRVVFTYVPAGSQEALLAGAVTERMPGDPPQPAPASLPNQNPTPMPVAAATPVPTPLPTVVPTPVPALAPSPEPTSVPEPAATTTPVPLLVTASSLASRGVGTGGSMGDNQPANGSAASSTVAPASEPSLASQEPGAMPLEEPVAAAPDAPAVGTELPAREGGRGIMVWAVLAVFTALVAGGGGVYYYLRMRRR